MDIKRKILIVDDAPMFRELESLFLARIGRVFTSGEGEEALGVAHEERPDVIIADLSMPGMGGDELCRRVKADPDLRRTPVVIVTGGERGDDHERAVRAGADDVLEKPVNRLALIQAVNRFLRLAVRGLSRVPLETDVRLGLADQESWGWSRNLSRGGMFVESDTELPPDTELRLQFALPQTQEEIAPTARVIWRRGRARRADGDGPDPGALTPRSRRAMPERRRHSSGSRSRSRPVPGNLRLARRSRLVCRGRWESLDSSSAPAPGRPRRGSPCSGWSRACGPSGRRSSGHPA
jgi:CheY-like chemotaxis protein